MDNKPYRYFYLQKMSPTYTRKEPCHFCRSARGVDYWAFVKDDKENTHSVPCCKRCIKKLERKRLDHEAKKILSELSGLPMSASVGEMNRAIIFGKD